MLTKIFLLQLILTFLVGTCWIYMTVLVGTRLGSKIGGFIGGLPSTALLAFFFIGFTQSPEIASSATTEFPIGVSISGIFLVVYAAIVRKNFIIALISSLCFWFLSTIIVLYLKCDSFIINLIIYVVAMLSAFIILERFLMVNSVSATKSSKQEKHLIIRSAFGGLMVTVTVLIEKVGGPAIGGIFAAFPAMFISLLVISYKANGAEFSRALTKPMMVTGMITLVVYAIALRFFYLSTGLYLGTLLSICISGISAFFTYRYILPRLK